MSTVDGPLPRGPLADQSLNALLDELASSDPTPGAGPTAAWTCADPRRAELRALAASAAADLERATGT